MNTPGPAPVSSPHFDFTFYVGGAFIALTLLALLLGVYACTRQIIDELRRPRRSREFGFPAFLLAGCLTAFTLLTATTYYAWGPLDNPHALWRPVAGQLTHIDSSTPAPASATVVRFTGNDDQLYPCTDLRCTGLRVGDHLELSCRTHRLTTFTDPHPLECHYITTHPSPEPR